jgi:hypothetical protein
MLYQELWVRDITTLSDAGMEKLTKFRVTHTAALIRLLDNLWSGGGLTPSYDTIKHTVRSAGEFIDEALPNCTEKDTALLQLRCVRACMYEILEAVATNSPPGQRDASYTRSEELNAWMVRLLDIARADIARIGWLFEAALMRLP